MKISRPAAPEEEKAAAILGSGPPAPQHWMVRSLSEQSSECWLVPGVSSQTWLPCLMQSVGISMIFTEKLGSIIEICCIITGIATTVPYKSSGACKTWLPSCEPAAMLCIL